MAEETFSDLGRIEAIAKLYEGTPYKPFESSWFETSGKSFITSQSRTFLEGIDFDLVYFPLKHLGYKCVTAVTGELYVEMSHPRTLDIRLGISSKLDFKEIKDIWEGIVSAAKEHGYSKVSLDLLPSPNGLSISVSATGETSQLTAKRRPAGKSMDLICVEQLSWDFRSWKERKESLIKAEMQRHSLNLKNISIWLVPILSLS